MNGQLVTAGQVVMVLAVMSLAGCDESALEAPAIGRRAASKVAAEDLPVMPVQAFDRHLRDACRVEPEAPRLSDVALRQPYLQQVRTDSALLTWTARTSAPMGLDVSLPDGTPVRSLRSTIEPTTYLQDAWQHVARIDGLEPGTIYCYRLVGAQGPTSPVGFETPPAPGSDEPLTLVAIGDAGNGSDDQWAVRTRVREVPFDLLLPLGDNAYERGTLAEYEANFFSMYASVMSSVPVLPISGNHEYRTDAAAPFRELFALPSPPDTDERYFSFDVGDVHLVGLDSEIRLDQQARWLDADLAATDQPWTIVMIHRPPWSSGFHGSELFVREAFGEILRRHEVTLVLSGHEHNYERTVPIDGTIYVVSGGGGRETRRVGRSWFTAFSDEVLHYLWLQIEGDRLELRAVDATGTVFDRVVLRR